jgi:release factor glutamine methyltransferase
VARLDAQLLLLHALGRPQDDRAWLLAHDDDRSPSTRRATAACRRRLDGEPLAYLVGEKEFFGLPLQVDAGCWCPGRTPRPWSSGRWRCSRSMSAPAVLDLGTGSGAIALAIQSRRPDARVVAVDRSAGAVAVGASQRQRLDCRCRWCRPTGSAGAGRFDLVVSNPPYVAAGDRHLAALGHEPQEALVAGPDGLDDLRRIVAGRARPPAPGRLAAAGAWLGPGRGRPRAAGGAGFGAVDSRRDLAGVERCSGGQWLERG